MATPIGNLGDITIRAVDILSTVDNIAAEDTRKSRILFNHHGIKPKRLLSYFGPKEEIKAKELLNLLEQGETVALITDAGTPGISDPAGRIVRLAIENGINIIPIPGPSALIAALPVSGFDTSSFVFEGFLPVKSGRRKATLERLYSEGRTVILYESTHRILKLLDELESDIPERKIVVARELTKMFEEFVRGTPSEVKAQLTGKRTKGEFVVLIEGEDKKIKGGSCDGSS
ncbi:MAG: 16S rRNA (cytidine(1402)-2'-O)-methyltransferase [Nitrospinota bacterium]|nr:16S rRNA (cytidine(1402)-2'-O)-methyltransferase [Nitrospinota bacterium]